MSAERVCGVQCDVYIDAGPTSLDPSQTSFFQALGISTKINKGSIEILSKVHIIKKGDKVGSSEATLLGKLNVKPFEYGLEITKVYDNGDFFDAAVLDIGDEDLEKAVAAAVQNIAAACLALNYPTLASVPHSIINAYKNNVLAFALGQETYSFPQADKARAPPLPLCSRVVLKPNARLVKVASLSALATVSDGSRLCLQVKEILANPDAFAAAAAPVASAGAAVVAAAPVEEEEEEEEMEFDLF